MGAQLLLVVEELGLFKLAHQRAQLQQHAAVLAVPAEIALRQRMLGEGRRASQVQHQVEFFAQCFRLAAEIDGTGDAAHLHAGPVRLAQAHVDLVVKADRAFRAGRQAGVAAGTQIQVNRVAARPVQLKSAQPAGQLLDVPGQHRIAPLLQPAVAACAQAEQCDVERI